MEFRAEGEFSSGLIGRYQSRTETRILEAQVGRLGFPNKAWGMGAGGGKIRREKPRAVGKPWGGGGGETWK